ncbi:MAG: KEOPS complex subunit Pcc1 [Acidilobaceae archaeon]
MRLCVRDYAKPLYESLLAEVNQPAPSKAKIEVSVENDCVCLRFEAKDFSKVRAVFNSYTYLVYAMYSALRELNPRLPGSL